VNEGRRRSPLVAALLDPERVLSFGLRTWNDVLAIGREHGLLGRLGAQLGERGLLERIPYKARAHIRAVTIAAESSQTSVRWEVNRVMRALGEVDTPVVLLKGSAYVMAGLPAAKGRFVGDVDLMVPRDKIEEVERVLTEKGWAAAKMNEYDQRYYREWMHEIPPLQHPERETVLDIHHTILPLTSRFHPIAPALFAAAQPIDNSRLRVLGPPDMVLHSTVHVFNDEVTNPLRDLSDLHLLLCHFAQRPGFWEDLLARAELHGLRRPLYYLLRHVRRVFATPVPAAIEEAAAGGAPGPLTRTVMDWLFEHRFASGSAGNRGPGGRFAHRVFYLRAHWLRMPLPMLVQHLSVKAARRTRERFERKPEVVDA
jgi:hypothetical protein